MAKVLEKQGGELNKSGKRSVSCYLLILIFIYLLITFLHILVCNQTSGNFNGKICKFLGGTFQNVGEFFLHFLKYNFY